MPCFHPLNAFRLSLPVGVVKKGKNQPGSEKFPKIVFTVPRGLNRLYVPQLLPCGRCVGCRLERSRQWAIRCVHEASLYENNCFISLTYNNENLPHDGSLRVSDFQKFMKRLRKKYGANIRFYHCGEYGETFGRPHYHACLFNFDFPDKKLWKMSNGFPLYTSPSLEALWPFGYSSIGTVTFESAAYVARYIMKKINGDDAEDHYKRIHPETLETYWLKPEYTTMSRRPGIAAGWFEKYQSDVFPHDFVVINNKKLKPPKFYDRQYEIECPDDHLLIKSLRKKAARQHIDNSTPERLNVREQVQLAKLRKLPRNLD